MLNILIIDDELPARSRLRRLLGELPDCAVAGEAGSGEEALELIEQVQPDALLLDISMPGLDGMSLARLLKEQQPAPAVIFCTAWPDRALDAFDCDAVDYLLKPVRQDRLQEALDKVRRVTAADGVASGPQEFLYSTVGGRTELINIAEVVCLLAEDKYTTVVHEHGKTVINNSLVDLEDKHGERFMRVHRNALVAKDRIRGLDKVEGGANRVILAGSSHRPLVSRRQLPQVRRVIRESK